MFFDFTAIVISSGNKITNFDKEIIIKFPYKDDNNDRVVDDTNIKVKELRIFYLNETTEKWEEFRNVSYDYENKKVIVITDHFSIYAALISENQNTLSKIVVYPNPCRIKKAKYVNIGNLPNDAENVSIKIYYLCRRISNIPFLF